MDIGEIKAMQEIAKVNNCPKCHEKQTQTFHGRHFQSCPRISDPRFSGKTPGFINHADITNCRQCGFAAIDSDKCMFSEWEY